MKELQKQRIEGSGGKLFKPKTKLVKGTKFVSFLFIAASILISAGFMQAANVYYDLDSSTIMVTEKQTMSGDLTVTSGNILFSTTGTITQSGSGIVSFAGNVGIGTASPTANFQVAQSATGVGTVSNAASGTTVTGVGTQFLNTFKVGDTITIVGQTVAISAIASNTSMTTAAITNANSGVAYTLVGGTRFSVLGSGKVGISESSGSNFTYFQGGDQSTDVTYTLPVALPGATGYSLVSSDAGVLSWAATVAGTAHDLLSASHSDTVASAVTIGDLVIGTAGGWDDLAISATTGALLRSTGTTAAWSTTAYPDTIAINQLLFSSAANTVSGVTAGADAQFLVSVTGVPTFVTMGTDATIANTGAITIAGDAVALATDTTGDYVASITGGSGIASTGATTGENISHTLSLGALTADWTQSGAFDIILGNVDSQIQILGSAGGGFYGTLDAGALTAARAYTLPDKSGTIAMTTDVTSFGAGILRGQVNIFGFDYPTQCSTSCDFDTYATISRDIIALPNFPAVLTGKTRSYKLVVRYADDLTIDGNTTVQIWNTTTNALADSFTIAGLAADGDVAKGKVFVSDDLTIPLAGDDWEVRVMVPAVGDIIRIYSLELAAYDID